MRLRKFLRLPAAQHALLMKAAVLLWGVRLGLWLLPFRTLQRLLAWWIGPSPGNAREAAHLSHFPTCQPADLPTIDGIVWAVTVASRYVPKATCFTQALAVHALLQRGGHPTQIHIGVAKSDESQVEAHAWVECQGRVVVGGSDTARYAPLLRF